MRESNRALGSAMFISNHSLIDFLESLICQNQQIAIKALHYKPAAVEQFLIQRGQLQLVFRVELLMMLAEKHLVGYPITLYTSPASQSCPGLCPPFYLLGGFPETAKAGQFGWKN
jgi:hypothetical protein